MAMATKTRPSQTPWSPSLSTHPSSKPSTTPRGMSARTPGGAAAVLTPSGKARSPQANRHQQPATPNYFELVTETGVNPIDSNAGSYAQNNWNASSQARSRAPKIASPQAPSTGSQPRFEAFRRESEAREFRLSHGILPSFATKPDDGVSSYSENFPTHGNLQSTFSDAPPVERSESPANMDVDDPMSLGQYTHKPPALTSAHSEDTLHYSLPIPKSDSVIRSTHNATSLPRAESLPGAANSHGPQMISPQDLVDTLKACPPQEILILDLRAFPQFSHSRIRGAINLCIPTTLLKRPSFNVRKLEETFTTDMERARFARWRQAKIIIVYDASSAQLKDATSSVNTLKKFTNEGWQGLTLVVRGGFHTFSKLYPLKVDTSPVQETESSITSKLSIDPPLTAAPVAGGCLMPKTENAANPFFGNIRQNMDLLDGVGQISLKLPTNLGENDFASLPSWLKEAADKNNDGKTVANHFLSIERAEQQRMQKALSFNVSYGSPKATTAEAIQIAGIEKGTKNRYKDMLPFDHSRVRLQNVPFGGCDYVNASHIKSEWSNKHYIASQAPVPATFQDFWRVTWEQDVRTIVMLTAESEGPQRKSHPYWISGNYGNFKVQCMNEDRLFMGSPDQGLPSDRSAIEAAQSGRPQMSRRHSSNPSGLGHTKSKQSSSPSAFPSVAETPHVVVRTLRLVNTASGSSAPRNIIQLQFPSWPDFGAPAHPAHVLNLVQLSNAVSGGLDPAHFQGKFVENQEPTPKNSRPILVHCSAGCGRTGTFCTVDTVVDMLRQQQLALAQEKVRHDLDVKMIDESTTTSAEGSRDDWALCDDTDLVQKCVEEFRLQRLSMVQNLRQYVLCYECILEWEGQQRVGREQSLRPP